MLNIDLEYKRGILFLRLDGILDKNTSFILKDAIKKIVSKAGIKYLLINFEHLYKIDEYGISSIIDSYNKYLKNNGKLMVCGYNNEIRSNLEKTRFKDYVLELNNELSAFSLINI